MSSEFHLVKTGVTAHPRASDPLLTNSPHTVPAFGSPLEPRLPFPYLPRLELLREVQLLLNGIQQLAVQRHHVHLALGEFQLHGVLPENTQARESVDTLGQKCLAVYLGHLESTG